MLYVNNINELESVMHELLFDKSLCVNLIKKGNDFVKDYMTNRGNASEKLMEILEKYES